jgi:hypothetical protein
MMLDKDKYDLLSKNDFQNHFDRAMYFNRRTKKIFSLEAIEDHDLEWLRIRIESPNNTGTWQFYFNRNVPQETIKEILKQFGE